MNSKYFINHAILPFFTTDHRQESAEEQSTIELDDDPDALHALIRHLYNCGYDDTICKENVMSFNVKVYAIADKYDVKQLQKFAATRLSRVCDPERDLNDFIATVYAIDECNNPKDRTLWDVVIPKIKNNISYLLGTAEFRVVLDDIPQLKFDLLALLDAARPFTYGPPAFETQVRDAEEDDEDDESTVPIPSPRGGRYAGRGRRLG